MKTAVRGAVLVAAALGIAASPQLAAAQGTSPDAAAAACPAVDSLVSWALRSAPELAAARARESAVRVRAAAANGLEDPTLEVLYQDVGFPDNTVGTEEMSMLGAELRQPLPFFGKRAARHAAAAAEASVAAAEVEVLARRVASEVRQQYARLYAVDHKRESLESADALLVLLGEAAQARYAAGLGSMEAPLRAQLERAQLQSQMQDVLAERRSAEAELSRWLDRLAETRWGTVDSLPAVAPPPGDWPQLAMANAPAASVRRAAVTAAERRITLEEREGRPDLFAGAGYATRGDFDPVVTLRVGTGLPVWRGGRTGPRVEAARAEAVMARAELRQAEADARAAAAKWAAEYERRDAQARLLRETIVPQSHTTLEAARAAFETGRADFSALIDDFTAWLAARQALAEREAERFAAWAELQALLAPPAPVHQEEWR